MTEETASPRGASASPVAGEAPRERAYLRAFWSLAGAYWSSEYRWTAWGLSVGLVILTGAQVGLMIATNYWNANLFDALEQRSVGRFVVQIGVFAILLGANVSVTATHLHLKRRLQFGWRLWLTRRVTADWMVEGRAYQLSFMPSQIDNPDGRIAEDIRNATEAAIDLAHSMLYCALLFVSFVEILWTISGPFALALGTLTIDIPGHMVWLAFLYAGVGSTLAIWVGRPLVRATKRRQAAEGDFRFSLVRAREHALAIAVMHGDEDERRRLFDRMRDIAQAWHAQSAGLGLSMMFSSGYGLLAGVFPILITAPRYIGGAISLGVLMQTAQAFQQLTGALSWPVDNISRRAEWRASVDRVLDLVEAVETLAEDIDQVEYAKIRRAAAEANSLAFRDLWVANPDGTVIIQGFDAEIAAGERVLISGDPGAALKLFKAVAGLWPWGRGEIALPDHDPIFFVPQRSYLPIGPLRESMAYPALPDTFDTERLNAVLARVGLGALAARLEDTEVWEDKLTAGEQQRLAFARLLLHRPRWIFLQEATDALDPAGANEMMRLLESDLPEATLITIGFHGGLESFHTRKMVLERSADGHVLIHDRSPQIRRVLAEAGAPGKRRRFFALFPGRKG